MFLVQLTLLLQKVADLLLAELSNRLHIAVVLQQGKDVIGQDIGISIGTRPSVSKSGHTDSTSASSQHGADNERILKTLNNPRLQ